MKAFGDESGNFHNLLHGDEPHFVLAVITGDIDACRACAGKAVRHNNSLKEAKWNDLSRVEKRRFIDAVSSKEVSVAFAGFDQSRINRMKPSFALYDESRMTVRPVCFATGAIYAALLLSFDESISEFTFDKVWSDQISEEVIDILSFVGASVEASSIISSQSKGVQTADCVAGAVREHLMRNEWPSITEEWRDETDYSLSTVEKWLSEYRV